MRSTLSTVVVLAVAATGCAASRSAERGRVAVLDTMPDDAIVLGEFTYECPTTSTGIIRPPMEYAISDAVTAGADAILVVERSVNDRTELLKVKQLRTSR